jgi:two-component system sensor histidine kinase FlrB
MHGSPVLEAASNPLSGSAILQAELFGATGTTALQLAEEGAHAAAGPVLNQNYESVALEELVESDFATLTENLKTSYAELQTRVNDLTEALSDSRAARQQELAEKEQLANRLTALVDALPGGVLVLDQNHTIILANPVAADLLGEPLLNMNFLTVIGECAASMSRDGTQIVLRSGRRVSLSNQVHDGYGDQIVLITDITETYAAQAASHRDERLAAMGAMVARLAHQIRTPLASALLYLGAMERTQLDADDRQAINGKVRSRLKHLESLVNDSLQYVKGGESCAQDCSLFELLDALKASLAPVVEEKSCRWIESRPQEDVQIVGNQEALLSALVAIAENAVQLNDGAIITVSAATTAAGLQIEITDNGTGISPDIIDHIFDPYYSTRPGGTGLGLALAAVIARNHEAELIATNLKTGGARFTLTLPDERVQSMVAPSQASARLTGENLNG